MIVKGRPEYLNKWCTHIDELSYVGVELVSKPETREQSKRLAELQAELKALVRQAADNIYGV